MRPMASSTTTPKSGQQLKRLSKVLAKSFGITDVELLSSFKPARKDQLKEVCQLRQQVYGDFDLAEDERYLYWRYFTHPKCPQPQANQAQSTDAKRESCLWVLEFHNKVISALGCEPVELVCGEKTLDAIRNMDIIVAPEYDGRGLGAWMTLFMQTNHFCILANGANENSLSMLKKMFTPLPVRKNYRILFNTQHLIANKLNSSVAALFLAPLLDFSLQAKRMLNRSRIGKLEEKLTIREIQSVDQLVTQLPTHQGVLGPVKVLRDKQYITWRYGQNPNPHFVIHGLFFNEQLVGYVISRIIKEGQETKAQLLDWDLFESSDQEKRLAQLFIAALDHVKAKGAEYVVVLLNDEVTEKAVSEIGFSLSKVDSRFFVHCANADEWAPMFEAHNWYQSYSDSDGF